MSKYSRTYHLNFSPGATSDDRIAISCKRLIGKEIVILEKADGGNCGYDNGGTFDRSHAAYTTSAWSRWVRELHSMRIKGNLEDGLFLFGENLEGIHSIEYTNLKSYFYLFGARHNTTWLSWDKILEYAYLLDLEVVPVLFRGIVNSEKELEDLVNKFMTEPSELGGVKEGVVVRVTEEFENDKFPECVQKYVRPNHVTTDKHWSRNWKRAKLINK